MLLVPQQRIFVLQLRLSFGLRVLIGLSDPLHIFDARRDAVFEAYRLDKRIWLVHEVAQRPALIRVALIEVALRLGIILRLQVLRVQILRVDSHALRLHTGQGELVGLRVPGSLGLGSLNAA